MHSARSAITSPVVASLRTAPYAASPGLPRDPPSASMTTDVCPCATASDSGLRGADQDPVALLAAQHLVGGRLGDRRQVGGGELEAAAAAAAGPQRGGADTVLLLRAAARRASAGRRPGRRPWSCARPAMSASSTSISPAFWSRAACSSAARRSRFSRWALQLVRGRPARSRAAPSPRARCPRGSVIRRSRETSSSCIRSRSLGLVTSPWSIRCWSRVRRALTCSTSASALRCSRVEVVDQDPHVAGLAVELRALGVQGGQLLGLRDGGELVPELVEPGVELLEVEQLGAGRRRRLSADGSCVSVGVVGWRIGRPGTSTGR